MPRGLRTTTLGALERRLAQLSADREKVISAIHSAVERLTAGTARGSRAIARNVGRTIGVASPRRRRRRVSAEVRARLSKLAKERWAKAKKAGKKRLG